MLIYLKLSFSQNDCKFKLISNPVTGKEINAISISTNSMGKCILSKKDTAILMIYKTTSFVAIMEAKTDDIRIELDSVEITFDGDIDKKTICKIRGNATAENRSVLKPIIESPSFELILTRKLLELFMNSDAVHLKLFGERGTEGSAYFTKGDLKKIKKTLQCF
ncbi:hypothetical protein MgSA37_02826 [Mucilaginibacter gotjawali]|uniref:Uncharacterized protein n=1 Tax=Mucilaginibacter gotjawali TaxID=1550579 RepID=A0A0X8X3X2_9SPHI|nr:hypothetical protein MgSA37_02826 [Mucilaginibacter gotjawali]